MKHRHWYTTPFLFCFFIVCGILFWYKFIPCRPSIYRSLSIQSSDWLIEVHSLDCGTLTGGVDIQAVSKTTNVTQVLATGNDVWEAVLVNHTPERIEISIPNRSDIEISTDLLTNIDVKWEYTPRGDPQDRAHYKAWLHDAKNEANRDWYCKNIFSELPKDYYRDHWDQTLGETVYTPYGSRHSYCLEPR